MGFDLSQDGMSRGAEGPEQSRPRKVQPCGFAYVLYLTPWTRVEFGSARRNWEGGSSSEPR